MNDAHLVSPASTSESESSEGQASGRATPVDVAESGPPADAPGSLPTAQHFAVSASAVWTDDVFESPSSPATPSRSASPATAPPVPALAESTPRTRPRVAPPERQTRRGVKIAWPAPRRRWARRLRPHSLGDARGPAQDRACLREVCGSADSGPSTDVGSRLPPPGARSDGTRRWEGGMRYPLPGGLVHPGTRSFWLGGDSRASRGQDQSGVRTVRRGWRRRGRVGGCGEGAERGMEPVRTCILRARAVVSAAARLRLAGHCCPCTQKRVGWPGTNPPK